MKQKLLALLLIALLMPTSMWAALAVGDSFTVDGMTFQVTSISPNEVQVGEGGNRDSQAIASSTEGNVIIPSSVKDPDGNNYSVTSIARHAFNECSKITGIMIPESITSIGDLAFSSCKGLTAITIPNSVTSIGESAFSYCI